MALVRREVETQTSFMDKIIIQLKEIEPFLDRYVRTKLNQDSGSKVAKTVFGNSNEQPRLQKINVKTIRELTSFQKLLDEMSKRPEFTEGEKDIVEDLARNVVDPLQAKPNYHWTLLEFDQARKMLASLGELVGSRKEATCGSMVVDLCGGNGGSRHQNQRATNNIPLRNRHFVGRTGELDVIQKWIKDGNRLLTISGLGGVGKTSLAIEAAHEFMDQFAGGTYWINANGGRGESSIRSSMVKILSSKLSQQQMKAFENVELANLLTEHFCRYRCLAIIDNLDVEELSGLAKELVQGSWLQHSESSVIITSRLKRETLEEILMIQPVHITLECFSTEEGTKFLKKRIGRYKEKDDECKELVEELDGLPLALDHAGAHIKARRFKLTTFLKKFKTEKLKFLTKGKATKMTMASSDTHNTVVSTTWDMNLEYLITECKYAWEVAAVFSFVYPKHIPTILINEGFPRLENEEMAKFFSDEIKLKEIIFSLTKLSLFSEVHEDCLQVHRLVQELIREKVRIANSKMVVYDRAVRMLSCALEKIDSPKLQEEEQPSDMKVWSRVMDNVAYFLEHLKDQKMIFDKRLPLEAMCKLMDHTSLHYDILTQGPRAQEYRAMLQQNLREAKPDYRAKYASCLTAMERHAIQQLINPSSKVDMNDFYMRIPLATGPHGRIWTVTCPKLGKGNYALKTQRRRKFSKDTTLQEVDNLLQFGGHENLAKIYWAFVTEEDGFKVRNNTYFVVNSNT